MPVAPPVNLAVAVSGGGDSTALLHCTARMAAALGGARLQVHALHVHHGLMPEADAWLAGVAAQCRRWQRRGLPLHFHAQRLQTRPAPGDSIEAWARRERYAALAAMAQAAGCRVVLLAHHRRDQAETVLLQALRGAGPAGLSGMPRQAERAGITWLRPWLQQPQEAIHAYLKRWRLRVVHDPSNADGRFARSRLRQQVWPPLLAGFADAETALAAVAERAQEVRALIDEVAAADAAAVLGAQGPHIAGWLALSTARRAALLRHWLSVHHRLPLPQALLRRLLDELPRLRTGTWPLAGGSLRLYRGVLDWSPLQAGSAPAAATGRGTRPAMAGAADAGFSQPGRHAASPWAGTLLVEGTAEGGVPAALLQGAELRARSGGERFQAHAGGLPRSLKKQFQAAAVPAWARQGPLLFAGAQLVFVPGLGTDARALAADGWPRVRLRWLP